MGGEHYTHSGGAANYLCLPKVPKYDQYKDGVQHGRIDVWHWVPTVVQPFWQNPPRPQRSLCRLLCRVTWLNANDARTEWLSIRMDPGVSWVPDDWTLHPQESKRIRLYWQKRGVRPWNPGEHEWCLALLCWRDVWKPFAVWSICFRSRVDLRCVYQVKERLGISASCLTNKH